jgi:hypothetical protein
MEPLAVVGTSVFVLFGVSAVGHYPAGLDCILDIERPPRTCIGYSAYRGKNRLT